jgi:hypothetical protein
MWKSDKKGFTATGMDQKMIKFFMKLLGRRREIKW